MIECDLIELLHLNDMIAKVSSLNKNDQIKNLQNFLIKLLAPRQLGKGHPVNRRSSRLIWHLIELALLAFFAIITTVKKSGSGGKEVFFSTRSRGLQPSRHPQFFFHLTMLLRSLNNWLSEGIMIGKTLVLIREPGNIKTSIKIQRRNITKKY